ncbi:hypothetical protein [Streptomyces tubercidicus]|uniref:hypothetical protein n=1 Tax=Streptomyces tubercidicus TaxID=47759 RepID=UPI003789D0C4
MAAYADSAPRYGVPRGDSAWVKARPSSGVASAVDALLGPAPFAGTSPFAPEAGLPQAPVSRPTPPGV